MEAQLTNMKAKPVIIEGLNDTVASGLPVWAAKLEKPKPSPINILKTGPAKHAVMAMLANPLRAMVMLADKSPIELPHAKTVSPIIVPGICKTTPVKSKTATKWFATKSIHVAAIAKPYRANGAAEVRAMFPSPPGAKRITRTPTMMAAIQPSKK